MKKINIREALLEIDKKSYNQYDLTSLYEACKLDDKDKVKLVQYIDAYDHPSVIGGFLESKCKGVNESYGDDDVADIKGAEEIIKHINENEVPLFIDDDIDSEDNIVNAVKPLTEEVVQDDSKEVRKYVWKKIQAFDNLTDDDSYYWEFEQDIMDGISAKLVSDEIDVPDNAHYKFSLPEVNLNFFFQDNPEYCYYVVDKDSVEPFSKEEPVDEAVEIGECPICGRKFAEGELNADGACPKCGEHLHKTDSGAYEKTDDDIDESKSIKEANNIAYGNEKYKGYMIRQDRKYGGYNVYDKNDEMEDSGFKTIDKAKEFIDSLEQSNSIKEATNPNDNIHFKVGDEFEYINEYDTEVKVKVIDTDGKVLTTEETFKDNDGKENTTKQTSKITVDASGVECIARKDRNGKPGYLYPPSRDSFKEFDLDESKSTHCVYFTQDGIEQIEFEGTEDECNKYIADIEDEQNEYFGDEWPERFVKRLNEKVGTYAIVGWLSEHPQAYDDALAHFKTDDLDKVKEDDLVDWIGEHDQLYDDYVRFFKLDEDLDEGLWDDIKSVGKTVGKVAKKGWDNSYTKAVATGLKKAYDKSDLGKATKEIGDSIKATDTYQKAVTAVKGAKDFVKNNVGSTDRDPSKLSIEARGKNYRMSDLKYKDGDKCITPQEYASMGMMKRNKIRVIVPRGAKPITNESLYEAFNLTEDIDRAAIESQIKSIVNQFMEDQGFDADEIAGYSAVELKDTNDNMIQVEVRAELNYEDLTELSDKLDPIVQDADNYAYFEPVTSGILRAYIRLDQSDDIVDEEVLEEWTAKIEACNSLEELRQVYKVFRDQSDNGEYSGGTVSAVCDIVHNKVDTLDEAFEGETQYGVHQFSTDSIIFRGTEEECGKYIDADKNLWDDAEVYKIEPGDKHYLNEDILDTPIEDIEKFVAQAKAQFPGSDAYFDGNTNQVVVKLDNSVNEDLDTITVEDTFENYIIEALGLETYTQGFMDTVVNFLTPYKDKLLNFEYMILRSDDFHWNDDLTEADMVDEDTACDVVVYNNVHDIKWDINKKNTVKKQAENNGQDSLTVIHESINESQEKVYTKKNGDYLTKCDNGGYSAFSASNVHLGHIDDEDAQEAAFKFEKNQFTESINESAISSVEPVVKFRGKSSHTFTPDKKWEVDFDEEGNILARTRHGKPYYFSGHINDKTNEFGHTDEDAIIQAAREQHKLQFQNREVSETLNEDFKVQEVAKLIMDGLDDQPDDAKKQFISELINQVDADNSESVWNKVKNNVDDRALTEADKDVLVAKTGIDRDKLDKVDSVLSAISVVMEDAPTKIGWLWDALELGPIDEIILGAPTEGIGAIIATILSAIPDKVIIGFLVSCSVKFNKAILAKIKDILIHKVIAKGKDKNVEEDLEDSTTSTGVVDAETVGMFKDAFSKLQSEDSGEAMKVASTVLDNVDDEDLAELCNTFVDTFKDVKLNDEARKECGEKFNILDAGLNTLEDVFDAIDIFTIAKEHPEKLKGVLIWIMNIVVSIYPDDVTKAVSAAVSMLPPKVLAKVVQILNLPVFTSILIHLGKLGVKGLKNLNDKRKEAQVKEELEFTADELKARYGTDDVDIINAGKPEEERVALKEVYDDDISDEELASILGGDTKQEMPDGIETPEETEARLAK